MAIRETADKRLTLKPLKTQRIVGENNVPMTQGSSCVIIPSSDGPVLSLWRATYIDTYTRIGRPIEA